MNSLVILIGLAVLIIAVAVLGIVLKSRQPAAETGSGSGQNYDLRRSIVSPAERSFAGVLDGALPDGVTSGTGRRGQVKNPEFSAQTAPQRRRRRREIV